MKVIVPRAKTSVWSDPGPCWSRTKEEKRRSAILRCPNGHSAFLGNHTIANDGTVTPSVVCPHDDCDWHVYVLLEGWSSTDG